jgi:undecaprenyl-diphosphatase
MSDPITAVVLGVVEGITEFLPISSTGHLLIAQQWLPRQSDLFNVVIQAGAVMAVIPLFHTRFRQFIFNWRDKIVRDYFLKIVAAFVITGAGGYYMEKHGFKLPEKLGSVGVALVVGGVIFLLVERWLAFRGTAREKNDLTGVTWTVAIACGVGQLIAARYPGASRSGTTIIFCLLLGLSRPLATEYSFLVSIPTMLAASAYTIFKQLHRNVIESSAQTILSEIHHPEAGVPHEHWEMVILASLVSAVVSFIAVKWLLRYVQTHTFVAFGWYRIIVGAAVLAMLSFNR